MYLLYVDESGDSGAGKYNSPHFILSGLIIHQDNWLPILEKLKTFRKALKKQYGLNQRVEIHASELIRINKLKAYTKIRKADRINIIKDYCTQIPLIFDTCKVINICITKEEHRGRDIFELAWGRLLQRFDYYLKREVNDKGIVIPDDTESVKLKHLQRKMRVYNPVPSHFSTSPYNAVTDNILEDPFSRSSSDSYFIQTVDVIAHMLYRKEYPKGSLKKYGLEYLFLKLEPVLLKKASKAAPYGIVRQ